MSEICWPSEEEDQAWEGTHQKECSSKTGHCTRIKRVSESECRIKCLCGWYVVIPYIHDYDELCRVWDDVVAGHCNLMGD